MTALFIPDYPFKVVHSGEGSSPLLPPQLFYLLDSIAKDINGSSPDGAVASDDDRVECLPAFLCCIYDFLGK